MTLNENITVEKLKEIPTTGGKVQHAFKKSEKIISTVGEVYFSSIEKNIIRAWKFHTKMTLNLIVPLGMVKFVFYLEKKKEFSEYSIGEENYVRLTVPPKIWFGFQGLKKKHNLIMNLTDLEHDSKEIKRKSLEEINYNWSKI